MIRRHIDQKMRPSVRGAASSQMRGKQHKGHPIRDVTRTVGSSDARLLVQIKGPQEHQLPFVRPMT
jgi:hypothetical protein